MIDILIDASMNHIKVIPIGIVDMHKRLTEIGHKYQIIAVVGIKNPYIDAPLYQLSKSSAVKAILFCVKLWEQKIL